MWRLHKDTQTFELHKQFKKKVEPSKLAAHMEVYCKDRLIKALGRKKRKADSKIVANFMLNAANGLTTEDLKSQQNVGPWQGQLPLTSLHRTSTFLVSTVVLGIKLRWWHFQAPQKIGERERFERNLRQVRCCWTSRSFRQSRKLPGASQPIHETVEINCCKHQERTWFDCQSESIQCESDIHGGTGGTSRLR